jgi:hypothetical protein
LGVSDELSVPVLALELAEERLLDVVPLLLDSVELFPVQLLLVLLLVSVEDAELVALEVGVVLFADDLLVFSVEAVVIGDDALVFAVEGVVIGDDEHEDGKGVLFISSMRPSKRAFSFLIRLINQPK